MNNDKDKFNMDNVTKELDDSRATRYGDFPQHNFGTREGIFCGDGDDQSHCQILPKDGKGWYSWFGVNSFL